MSSNVPVSGLEHTWWLSALCVFIPSSRWGFATYTPRQEISEAYIKVPFASSVIFILSLCLSVSISVSFCLSLSVWCIEYCCVCHQGQICNNKNNKIIKIKIKQRIVLKFLSLCNKVLSYLCLCWLGLTLPPLLPIFDPGLQCLWCADSVRPGSVPGQAE